MDLGFITKIIKGDEWTIVKSFVIQSPFIYAVLFFYHTEFRSFEALPQVVITSCLDIFLLMCYRATILVIRVLTNRNLKLFITGLTAGTICVSIGMLTITSRFGSGLIYPIVSYAITFIILSLFEICFAIKLNKRLESRENNKRTNRNGKRKRIRKKHTANNI